MKIILGLLFIANVMIEAPRQVLLFYTKEGLAKQQAQVATLNAHQKDMHERDISVTLISPSDKDAAQWKKWKVDVSDPFTFILVGRDGGEKLRSAEVVSAEKLFGLIDAMPMRKSEVRRERNNK